MGTSIHCKNEGGHNQVIAAKGIQSNQILYVFPTQIQQDLLLREEGSRIVHDLGTEQWKARTAIHQTGDTESALSHFTFINKLCGKSFYWLYNTAEKIEARKCQKTTPEFESKQSLSKHFTFYHLKQDKGIPSLKYLLRGPETEFIYRILTSHLAENSD